MQCSRPIKIFPNHISYPDGLLVPCGKCLSCKIARSREWAVRIIHELVSWHEGVFVTLTYSDLNLAKRCISTGKFCNSLDKNFLRKFFKRFRKKFSDKSIKYFACGEYGDKTNRPHYHAIIFGLRFWEHDVVMEGNDKGLVLSGPLFDVWREGRINLGTVTYNSAHYCAKYIDKISFSEAVMKRCFDDMLCERPFKIVSLGLGKKFAILNRDALIKDGVIYKGIHLGMPKYYQRILKIDSAIMHQKGVERKWSVLIEMCEKGLLRKRDFDRFYSGMDVDRLWDLCSAVSKRSYQRDLNIRAKISNKDSDCKL
nr:MAG: replication initiator protein [Microviridae sp.]